MTRLRRLALRPLLATGALLWAGAAAAAPTLDLGDPSVLSQQGQRLKIVMPYGSAPGERVSPMRFEVVSVQVPEGFVAPAADDFTLSSPGQRNLVFLQSREPVDAPEVVLTVRVADQPDGTHTWRIGVPPAIAAAPQAAPAASAHRPARAAWRPVGRPVQRGAVAAR